MNDSSSGTAAIPTAATAAASDIYGDFLKELLIDEQAVKASLEQRGLAVVSSAGALVTLLLGIVGLVYNVDRVNNTPIVARWLLLLSVAAFVLASIFGILTNKPMGYEAVGQDALRKMVEKQYWNGPREVGAWRIARLRARLVGNARVQNAKKAQRLRQAVWAGGCGILFAALSVIDLLFQ
jgi:uncharacterized membrane protein